MYYYQGIIDSTGMKNFLKGPELKSFAVEMY